MRSLTRQSSIPWSSIVHQNVMAFSSFADMADQYARHPQLQSADVAAVEEWQRQQPHLPAPQHPIQAALFLHMCGYRPEAAKQRIDTYFTIRNHCPALFANWDIFSPELQLALDTWILVQLPERAVDGAIVFYLRLRNPNLGAFNFSTSLKLCDMALSLFVQMNGCCDRHTMILDMEGAKWAHLTKLNLMVLKKSVVYLQTAAPARVTSINYVNAGPFIEKLIMVARPFISKQLLDVLHVHYGDNATIFKDVPKEILPIECGGATFSATDYYDNFTRPQLETYSEYFKQQEHRLADESKRPPLIPTLNSRFGLTNGLRRLTPFGRKSDI